MAELIIKAKRGRDLYMVWHTGVNAPTFIGTRAELVKHLDLFERRPGDTATGPTRRTLARVHRADQTGTSAVPASTSPGDQGPLTGAWDSGGVIFDQRGWLPRDRFAEFLDAYLVDLELACALLDPFDDDE